eukprot:210063-Rhodomonas_salina.3
MRMLAIAKYNSATPYALPTRCPVLTQHMLLPAAARTYWPTSTFLLPTSTGTELPTRFLRDVRY